MTTDDELQVRFLMGEISRAFIERDVEALRKILADDFTVTEPTGVVVKRDDWLADVASGDLAIQSVESESFDLQPIPGAIKVRGRLRLRAGYSKSNYNGLFSYIGIYTKQPEGWRLKLSSARRVVE